MSPEATPRCAVAFNVADAPEMRPLALMPLPLRPLLWLPQMYARPPSRLSLDDHVIPLLDFLDTCQAVRSDALLRSKPHVLYAKPDVMHANKEFFLGECL